MRPPLLALALSLLLPGAAFAEPPDAAEETAPPALEAPALDTDSAPSGDARLGDLEAQIDGPPPLALEPKFDLSAEQPDTLSGTSALDHSEPEPAPGIMFKIPTN